MTISVLCRVGAVILLVEDDLDSRNALVAFLELKGLAVVTATDGAEAIGRLEAGLRPSVMLIDLMLPEVTGWDSCNTCGKSLNCARFQQWS